MRVSFKDIVYGGGSYAKDDSFKMDKSKADDLNMYNKDSAQIDIDSSDYKKEGMFNDKFSKQHKYNSNTSQKSR